VIPLCVHSIRTPAVIRLPYVEKWWKSPVSSREMFYQKVKAIYRKTDLNWMTSYTDRSVTPGQDPTKIALPYHTILNIITNMAVSSIRDSDALMSVYRTDIS
jgi:hypothetical protein